MNRTFLLLVATLLALVLISPVVIGSGIKPPGSSPFVDIRDERISVSLSEIMPSPSGVLTNVGRKLYTAPNANRDRPWRSVISGGSGNFIPRRTGFAAIGGGYNNTASGTYATVAGGSANNAGGVFATVGGGQGNAASGDSATVPGGSRGEALHVGSFVWGGDSSEATSSFGDYTFTVRCKGGARFYSANGTVTGVSLSAGGGAWDNLSDRDAKANFQKVNATDVLAKVAAMPVMTWNYKTQDESIRHIGPTAQDFRSAFGLGDNDKTISTIDPSGVALAAIQGLVEELKVRDAQMAERDKTIGELKSKLQAVEERLNSLPPQ